MHIFHTDTFLTLLGVLLSHSAPNVCYILALRAMVRENFLYFYLSSQFFLDLFKDPSEWGGPFRIGIRPSSIKELLAKPSFMTDTVSVGATFMFMRMWHCTVLQRPRCRTLHTLLPFTFRFFTFWVFSTSLLSWSAIVLPFWGGRPPKPKLGGHLCRCVGYVFY